MQIVKLWSPDQQYHLHLGTCEKCRFSNTLPDLLVQKSGNRGKHFVFQHGFQIILMNGTVWEPLIELLHFYYFVLQQVFFNSSTIDVLRWLILCCGGLSWALPNVQQPPLLLLSRCQQQLPSQSRQSKMSAALAKCPMGMAKLPLVGNHYLKKYSQTLVLKRLGS